MLIIAQTDISNVTFAPTQNQEFFLWACPAENKNKDKEESS